MIFQHTLDKVLSGEKTQTRRLAQPNDWRALYGGYPPIDCAVFNANGHLRFKTGQVLAVQPGRGQKGVARIKLLAIDRKDVRDISPEDAVAEGFETPYLFLKLWTQMHDSEPRDAGLRALYFNRVMKRPAEHYDAWKLTFERVS